MIKTATNGLPLLTALGSDGGKPQLLVSVRNAAETAAAAAGGAAVIDIKEPAKGPLGEAEAVTRDSVVELIADHVPVTAAFGELIDVANGVPAVTGLSAVKVGLAGLVSFDWQTAFTRFQSRLPACTVLVPVAYADAKDAQSPSVNEVLQFAAQQSLPWIVLDTANKTRGDLFDGISATQVADLLASAAASGIKVVLAGSLRGEAFDRACQLGPDLIGVRGAACVGGRNGVVCESRVRQLSQALDGCRVSR